MKQGVKRLNGETPPIPPNEKLQSKAGNTDIPFDSNQQIVDLAQQTSPQIVDVPEGTDTDHKVDVPKGTDMDCTVEGPEGTDMDQSKGHPPRAC